MDTDEQLTIYMKLDLPMVDLLGLQLDHEVNDMKQYEHHQEDVSQRREFQVL